jgi:uncharacterized membrane protein YgcG
MNELSMLLGAALVIAGVLASALADRIRGLRVERRVAKRAATEDPNLVMATEPKMRSKAETIAKPLGDQVMLALVQSGYTKPIAKAAVWSCKTPDRASLEQWTKAAFVEAGRA